MKTYLDCIPCFFKLALQIARVSNCTPSQQKEILDEISRKVPEFKLDHTPPEMGYYIQQIVQAKTGIEDPYKNIKLESICKVNAVYQQFEEYLEKKDNRILAAVELAIAANIIDYGANTELDLEDELLKLMQFEESRIGQQKDHLFNFEQFYGDLDKASNVLYIGDNVGEHLFDKLLMKQIKEIYPNIGITYATRGASVLNDVTLEEALDSQLDQFARIISSGSQLPGTILSTCTTEFKKIFNTADMIISKGQGNYETMSDLNAPIYFLLMAKCPVVASHAEAHLKDFLLLKSNVYKGAQ